MLELFTKTLVGFVDKNLSALLLGAAAMLLLLIQYFKVPDRWNEHTNKIDRRLELVVDRLEKIEDRQRRIFDFFKYSSGRVGTKLPSVDFEFNSEEFDNEQR